MRQILWALPSWARMRQRQEDAWVRKHERPCAEIEKNHQEDVVADKWYHELEMRNEALQEQNTRHTGELNGLSDGMRVRVGVGVISDALQGVPP